MGKAQRRKAKAAWEVESARRQTARAERNIFHITPEDLEEFNRTMAEQRAALTPPAAPAMPVASDQLSSSWSSDLPPHQENVQASGFVSNDWFA